MPRSTAVTDDSADPRADLEVETVELFEHDALRDRQVETDLRVLVQPVPDLGQVMGELLRIVAQSIGE